MRLINSLTLLLFVLIAVVFVDYISFDRAYKNSQIELIASKIGYIKLSTNFKNDSYKKFVYVK
ncbi:MAG: hypothetical protein B1H07_01195 [Campylobacteraceae bacterium 4484_166]|nr:MAG: hypothetical protein B1H07_01195 [Campylobacteraceae bacterium 4484_166]